MTLYILQYHTFKTLRGEVKQTFEIQIEKFKHPNKIYYYVLSICAPKNLNNPLTPG